MASLTKLIDFLRHGIWEIDPQTCPPLKRSGLWTLKLLIALGRDLTSGELTLRAMSMVYTTLLSLVPLLAVSFSVLKAFGVHNQMEPLLLELFSPLGPKGAELTQNIIGFVDNMRVGVLGTIGLAFLFYTVVSLISKIEKSFNHVWQVKRPRPFLQRFSYYLSVLLIGPALVFSALGLTATMLDAEIVRRITAIEPFGTLLYLAGLVVPYLLTVAAFAFIYIFLPNTKVQVKPALIGALVAGVAWKLGGQVFAVTIASSGKYAAIYSSFAILIVFLIWLYVSWLIFLLGEKIAFYIQKPGLLNVASPFAWRTGRSREGLAFSLMHAVGERFLDGEPPPTAFELGDRLSAPERMLDDLLEALEEKQLIVKTGDSPCGYLPARDLDRIDLYDILRAVRHDGGPHARHAETSDMQAAQRVLQDMDGALAGALKGRSLKQWLRESR